MLVDVDPTGRQSPDMSTSTQLIAKWRRWLHRIENDQLQDLLINRHIFHQFRDCIAPHTGSDRGADLASWMGQNYVAFAATAIRRMVEPPKTSWKSISLIILLMDLAANNSVLTRERFRCLYKHSVAERFVDRDFAKIAGSKSATLVSAARVKRDIHALKTASKRITKLVDKVVAHTEEDRRKVPHVQYGQIDKTIDLLEATFRRYCLLLNGSCPDPIVPLDDFDVVQDLKRIWP
jgi:hypothetical protein